LKIKVKAKTHWSLPQRQRVRKAAKMLAAMMNIKAPTIYLTGPLIVENDECYGYATENNKIFLSDCDNEDPILYLAHEMIHIQQYQRGDLREKNGYWIWKSKIDHSDYENQPWEIEAYDKMYDYYDLCIQYL